MSQGELCGHKIKIATKINGTNTIEVECDNWKGHEGDHSKMFYHITKMPNETIFKNNYRLGSIKWKNNYE